MAYIRGSNPVWLFDDLFGNLLDDNYWFFVLENEIPYIPANVWHDSSGSVVWSNPIQFLANGTLPIDIFFDPSVVYRLEIRRGNTQQDPLIYLIENYVPGSSGDIPISSVALATANQITNPQFSIINFSSPFTITSGSSQTIEIAPGWSLDLAGTGNVTLTQVPLNNSASTVNPSNAPYALQITLSGSWSTAQLRQRFQQNGMLWANKTVSSSITARIEGAPQNIDAILVDSNATTLGSVLDSTPINDTFNEYLGYATLPATTNPDIPPAAYVDYILNLPTSVDIYLTSFQLVAQNLETTIQYEQDSIDRQIDHTFHNYYESIIIQPKASILTGWNFALNPWQFTTTAANTIVASSYTADQTIVAVQNASSLQSLSQSNTGYFCIQAVGAAAQGKFAIIQYIDTRTIAPYWGEIVSSLVRASISTTHSTALQFKMRLIYRSNVPPAVDPISSWSGTNPTFSAGWTAIAPLVDNIYTIDSSTITNFPFNGFQLPAAASGTKYLGIVLYTVNTLDSSATPDFVCFDKVSLVPNAFALDSPPQTYDQVLRECSYYYEKSYAQNVLPGTSVAGGALLAQQGTRVVGLNDVLTTRPFGFSFKEICRTDNPTITLYSPQSGTSASVYGYITVASTSGGDSADIAASNWTETQKSSTGVSFEPNNDSSFLTEAAGSNISTWIIYHYTRDGRLGLIA